MVLIIMEIPMMLLVNSLMELTSPKTFNLTFSLTQFATPPAAPSTSTQRRMMVTTRTTQLLTSESIETSLMTMKTFQLPKRSLVTTGFGMILTDQRRLSTTTLQNLRVI